MIKTFKLASQARRTDALLGSDTFPSFATLHDKVEMTLNRLRAANELWGDSTKRVIALEDQLAVAENQIEAQRTLLDAANAKIAKMTSGLKRGTRAGAKS